MLIKIVRIVINYSLLAKSSKLRVKSVYMNEYSIGFLKNVFIQHYCFFNYVLFGKNIYIQIFNYIYVQK